MKKDDVYYEALRTRDPRFDGKFFVGVKTTGIYCRPICPAKPKRENIEFFSSHFEAERAGYRPCLRCRPESAPKSPAWIGKSAVVQRAVKVLNSRDVLDLNEDQFAAQFGVSARHLRRLFIEEIGKTPKQLSFENRLNLARKLIVETPLSFNEVASASGFSSIRRFNDAFKERFKKAPRDIRRHKNLPDANLKLLLAYRPPFDYLGLLRSYQNHQVGNLEWFQDNKMYRIISMNGKRGHIVISHEPELASLAVEIVYPDTSVVYSVISRVRAMFDLDSDPLIIANSLEQHPVLRQLCRRYPGIRLPSGWESFEIAISTILGQLVSVERGRKLVSDLMELAGDELDYQAQGEVIYSFPTPEQILCADITKLKTTNRRKQTLLDFSKAIIEGELSLEPAQDVDEFVRKVTAIKGIGPWTAQYMALKILRDTDSFPASDLVLARALKNYPLEVLEKNRPWRAYAAALFWRACGESSI